MVAWLGHFNPFEMIFTAFLVAFITLGGSYAGDVLRFGNSYSKVLIGIFFFVFIASEFFLKYKVNFSPEAQAFFGKIRDFFNKIFAPIIKFFKNLFSKIFKKKKKNEEVRNEEE